MVDPRKMTNDDLALHIEFWANMNQELTIGQLAFFDEVVWRLRLLVDKEQETSNE
jgi:hypothetical protein